MLTMNREEVKTETTLADLKFIPARPFCLEMHPGSHTLRKAKPGAALREKAKVVSR